MKITKTCEKIINLSSPSHFIKYDINIGYKIEENLYKIDYFRICHLYIDGSFVYLFTLKVFPFFIFPFQYIFDIL